MLKTILLSILAIYAITAGILYFRLKLKQNKNKEINAAYIMAMFIAFIVFIFWGWLLYPIALLKQHYINKAIENNDTEKLEKFLD